MEQPPSPKRAKLESKDDQSVRMSVNVHPTSGAAPSSSLKLPDIQQASFSEECKVADSPQELTQIVRFNKPPPSPTQTALNSQPPLILAGVSSSTVYLTSTQTTVVTTQSSYYTSSNLVEGTSSLEGQNVSVSQHTTWSLASPPLVSSSSTSSSVPVQCQVSPPLTVTQNVQSDSTSTSHHTLTQSINPLTSLTPGETSQEKLVSAPLVSLDSKSTIYTESYGHIHGNYPISTSQPLATVVTATPPLMTTSPLLMMRETLSQSKLVEREENLQLNTVAEIGHTTCQVQGQTLTNMKEKSSWNVVAQQTISPLPLLQYAVPRSLTTSTHSPSPVIQSDPLSIFSSRGAMTSTKEHFQESGVYLPTESELHIPVTSIPLGEVQGTVVGPQHYTMATSQALSTAVTNTAKQYSAGDNANFISTLPSSTSFVALNKVGETSLKHEARLVTKIESRIPVNSVNIPSESTPISDLQPVLKTQMLVPVQSTLARLQTNITHQGQTIPSIAGGSILNTIAGRSQAFSSSLPPSHFYTTFTHTSPNSTAVAMWMSTHQPFTVTQSHSTVTFSFDRDPVLSSNKPYIEHKSGLVPAHKSSETQSNVGGMQYHTMQMSSNIKERHLLSTVVPSSLSPLCQQTPAIVTQPPTAMHQLLVSRSSPSTLAHASPGAVGDSSTSINPEGAGEAFREHRDDLLIAITDTPVLANRLYSHKIICWETKDRIMLPSLTGSEKNFILLDAVESRIRTNPSDFFNVLTILDREPHLCVFAERILNSYCLIQSSWKNEPSKVSPRKRLNTYLINYYNCSQKSLDMKFPRLPHKNFISLAVIEKESVSRADADKFTKGTLHGHADEILRRKTSIELEAVLVPPEGCQNMKLLFVEGAPGVGKSTFALELCRRQKEIKAMEKYSLAVLLRLREKRVQNIKKVSDLFYHEDSDLVQAVTEEVVGCKGRGVLFVLDGFDELPANLRIDSFIVELIQGKHLPACTVLVTSRPSSTADLYLTVDESEIDKHMEIIGFTHDRIKEYASSILSVQPDVLEDFLKYISNNPAIHGMMYIPLNCAIVVEIYKANRTISKPIPRTLTQLYTELCLVLLRKYLIEKCDPLADKLPDNINDLPEDLKQQLVKLGKLAFDGALKKEIVFEKLPDSCNVLGFMNMSTGLYMGRAAPVSYSFLHLTLQEFLGAVYISQLQGVEKKLLFIENLEVNETGRQFNTRNYSHLDVMWRFVAGLTGLQDVGYELLHKATNLSHAQTILPCEGYDPLFVRCLLEIQDELKTREMCESICKECLRERNKNFLVCITSPFDCYAAGYCAAASGCQWSVVTSIKGNETVELLGCGFRSVQNICGHLNSLKLSENSLTLEAINHLSQFPSAILNQLCELNLSDNLLKKEAFDRFADILPCMLNLNSLDVTNNPCGHGGMVRVLQKLLSSKIKKLKLAETNIGVADFQALSQLINSATSLNELSIGGVSMPSESAVLLVDTVLSPSSLKTLECQRIIWTEESASKFQLLKNNENLTNLKFSYPAILTSAVRARQTQEYYAYLTCDPGLNLVALYVAQALHTNESLKVLEMPSYYRHLDHCHNICAVGSGRVKELSEMLRVNSTLKSLELAASSLTTEDVFKLNDALKQNASLQRLHLWGANVFDERFSLHKSYVLK